MSRNTMIASTGLAVLLLLVSTQTSCGQEMPPPAPPDEAERGAIAAAAVSAASGPDDCAGVAPAGSYRTIVVFGDSQHLVEKREGSPEFDEFKGMVDWIVRNKCRENIDLVLHVGDAIQSGEILPAGRECLGATCRCTAERRCTPSSGKGCLNGKSKGRDCLVMPPPEGCYAAPRRGDVRCFSCCQQTGQAQAQWDRFRSQWARLEPKPPAWQGIPYAIARGAHDNLGSDVASEMDVPGFRQHFSAAHFDRLSEGFRNANRVLERLETCPEAANSGGESCFHVDATGKRTAFMAHAFRARLGNTPILVIATSPEFNKGEEHRNWVRGVLRRNKPLPAILLGHYLARRAKKPNNATKMNDIAKEPEFADQIFMLASGHVPASTALIERNARSGRLWVRFNRQSSTSVPAERRAILLIRFHSGAGAVREVEALQLDPVTGRLRRRLARRPFSLPAAAVSASRAADVL
jgi:hypothetical protein